MSGVPYRKLPVDVLYDEALSDKAKLFFPEIEYKSRKKGYCYASDNWFAQTFNVSVRTVKRVIRELRQAGYIKTSGKYPNRKIYINTQHDIRDKSVPNDKPIRDKSVPDNESERDTPVQDKGHPCPAKGTNLSNIRAKSVMYNNKRKKKRKRESNKSSLSSSFFSECFLQKFQTRFAPTEKQIPQANAILEQVKGYPEKKLSEFLDKYTGSMFDFPKEVQKQNLKGESRVMLL